MESLRSLSIENANPANLRYKLIKSPNESQKEWKAKNSLCVLDEKFFSPWPIFKKSTEEIDLL